MSEAIGIRIEGVRATTVNLERFGSVANTRIAEKMVRIVERVELSARQRAPRDTGRLISEIHSLVSRKGTEVIGTVKSPVFYSAFQEFGTSRNAPQPFMGPALLENEAFIMEELGSTLTQAVTQIRVA